MLSDIFDTVSVKAYTNINMSVFLSPCSPPSSSSSGRKLPLSCSVSQPHKIPSIQTISFPAEDSHVLAPITLWSRGQVVWLWVCQWLRHDTGTSQRYSWTSMNMSQESVSVNTIFCSLEVEWQIECRLIL